MSENLQELIELIKGHKVFIQTHNFPDPDAIASAFGLQVLLDHFGITTVICHHGHVERTVTANMVSAFNIKMSEDNDIADMSESDFIITVDSQKGNSNIKDLIGDEVACIDHHPIFFEAESYKYKDIRIVGATASIITDYYRKSGTEMPKDVATALLYGLKCDTSDFTRGVTEFDLDAYQYLFPRADNGIIRRLQAAKFQYEELDNFALSMQRVETFGGVAFVYLNFECADAFMGIVSDFILDIDAVYFVVVYSERGSGIKFSVRSELDDMSAGRIISDALDGIGIGGGHDTMAGGFAERNKIVDLGENVCEIIKERFLNVIRKTPRSGFSAQVISID